MGFDYYHYVPPIGYVGGLALWWKEGVQLLIWDKCSSGITDYCSFASGLPSFICSFTYASTNPDVRRHMWAYFRNMADSFNYPWIIVGDLNVIGVVREKSGGKLVQPVKIKELHDFLSDSPMLDIGFKGNVFTWMNKRFDGVQVKEILDRRLVNVEWTQAFPDADYLHETFRSSDHYPIVIRLEGPKVRRKTPFRFKANWLSHERNKEVISRVWEGSVIGSLMFQMATKLKLCKEELMSWRRDKMSNNKRN